MQISIMECRLRNGVIWARVFFYMDCVKSFLIKKITLSVFAKSNFPRRYRDPDLNRTNVIIIVVCAYLLTFTMLIENIT